MKKFIAMLLATLLALAVFGMAVAESATYGYRGDETVEEQF